MRQLASPSPFDLEGLNLDEYKGLAPSWRDWSAVVAECRRIATLMANAVATRRAGWTDLERYGQAAMRHRQLRDQRLTLAALDDLLENGTLADWRPVLARIRREPYGPIAARVEELLQARDYEETGALWRSVLDDARSRPPINRLR